MKSANPSFIFEKWLWKMSLVFETECSYENYTLASFWLAGISLNMHSFLKHVPYLTWKVNSYNCYHNRILDSPLCNGSGCKLTDIIIHCLMHSMCLDSTPQERISILLSLLLKILHVFPIMEPDVYCVRVAGKPSAIWRKSVFSTVPLYAPVVQSSADVSVFLNFPCPYHLHIGSHCFLFLECSCLPSQALPSCPWLRVPLTRYLHEADAESGWSLTRCGYQTSVRSLLPSSTLSSSVSSQSKIIFVSQASCVFIAAIAVIFPSYFYRYFSPSRLEYTCKKEPCLIHSLSHHLE